jgi:hypothetical protein
MKQIWTLGLTALFGTCAVAASANSPVVVTASNTASNQLLVYDTAGVLLQSVPTQGQGGVGGNAGGVAAQGSTVAVINFGSWTVSILTRDASGFSLAETLTTQSAPVSVAFGKDHLYVLGTTTVESHRLQAGAVDQAADGVIALLRADGSAAQVGVLANQLLISEKSGAVEVADLRAGAVVGPAVGITLPAGSDTPLGLATRGANGYVTIAHSDLVALVKNGSIVDLVATGSNFPTGPGAQAPCWLALTGPYLFSSDSPSHAITRFVVSGHNIIIDSLFAAHTIGAPVDIAAQDGLLAVIESNGSTQAHLTQFSVDADGNLTQTATTAIAAPANGLAIVTD